MSLVFFHSKMKRLARYDYWDINWFSKMYKDYSTKVVFKDEMNMISAIEVRSCFSYAFLFPSSVSLSSNLTVFIFSGLLHWICSVFVMIFIFFFFQYVLLSIERDIISLLSLIMEFINARVRRLINFVYLKCWSIYHWGSKNLGLFTFF